jgi:hypothetical protein
VILSASIAFSMLTIFANPAMGSSFEKLGDKGLVVKLNPICATVPATPAMATMRVKGNAIIKKLSKCYNSNIDEIDLFQPMIHQREIVLRQPQHMVGNKRKHRQKSQNGDKKDNDPSRILTTGDISLFSGVFKLLGGGFLGFFLIVSH